MRVVSVAVLAVAACLAGNAAAQTKFSYFVPNGMYIRTAGVQASTTNAGFLDVATYFASTGYAAGDAPQQCLHEVYYFDLTTPFGQGVHQMVQTSMLGFSGQQVRRIDFTKNSDGRCWLTLLQF